MVPHLIYTQLFEIHVAASYKFIARFPSLYSYLIYMCLQLIYSQLLYSLLPSNLWEMLSSFYLYPSLLFACQL